MDLSQFYRQIYRQVFHPTEPGPPPMQTIFITDSNFQKITKHKYLLYYNLRKLKMQDIFIFFRKILCKISSLSNRHPVLFNARPGQPAP